MKSPTRFYYPYYVLTSRSAISMAGKMHQVKSSLASLSISTHIQLDSLEDAKAFRVGAIRGYGSADSTE